MHYVTFPCVKFNLHFCPYKSLHIPDMKIDGKGIMPDYYLDKDIRKEKWIDWVREILNE